MNKAIMIVDDSQADQFIVQNLIGKVDQNIKLYQSWDGKEAIDFLKDFKRKTENEEPVTFPSMILLDINMPRMNGFEFLDEYKKLVSETDNKDLKNIPIIMFTSSDDQRDKRKAKAYSFVQQYIVKPLDLESLHRVFRSLGVLN